MALQPVLGEAHTMIEYLLNSSNVVESTRNALILNTEVLQSGLNIVEYAPLSFYLPRFPQEALLCRRLWTFQPS